MSTPIIDLDEVYKGEEEIKDVGHLEVIHEIVSPRGEGPLKAPESKVVNRDVMKIDLN